MLDLALVALPNPALDNPKMYYGLGILYVAAAAKREGFSVCMVDMRSGTKDIPPARFTGFSCTTPEIAYAVALARNLSGQSRTIVGGPHVTLCDDQDRHFDFVVRGEGEPVIGKILAGDVKPGVITVPRMPSLEDVPLPDWDLFEEPFSTELFPGERYGKGPKAATLILSRGCPFACSFCGNWLRNPMRYRTPWSIEEELQALISRGVSYFRLEDDVITLHPQFRALCLLFKRLGIRYKAHTRSDLITQQQAYMLRESGCEECGLGVESGDDRVLKLNNKREKVEDHLRAVRILHKAGMRVKTYLMSGLPGETWDSIELTKRFMAATKPDKWTLSTFSPYPGCDIWKNPEKYGVEITRRDYSTWWNFVFNVNGKVMTGREGYNHLLKGQTEDDMKARHDHLYQFLRGESWK